jgi:nicotinate phosphoribosyltransferase
MGIIKSILDLDFYKLSMMVAVIQTFPNQKVRYQFKDRNNISYPDGFDIEVMKEIKLMENLSLTKDEKEYLIKTFPFLPPTFIYFLEGYRFDSNEVKVSLDENNKLNLTIEGYWFHTILWETCLMSIISELYFKMTNQIVDIYDPTLQINDLKKLDLMMEHNAYFADFGTRRRYSFDNQYRICELFKQHSNHVFVGTSNVYIAYKFGMKAIGTLAHEWIMVHAAIYGYKMANKMAMDNWSNTYQGNLGTALSDTFTTDAFLKSFDMKLSKLFDGVRQDSGDPYVFADKMIEHYKSLGIDPMSKTIIFSDGLNTKLASEIKEYCVGKIKCSFGIGTDLTNSLTNSNGEPIKPLNIVIKISEVLVNDNWVGAIKLSDVAGKNMGQIKEIEICKHELRIN